MEYFLQAFDDFVENSCLRSKSFLFWNSFMDDIQSILIDLTRSHCEGDWNLQVSAVHQALPLFFALNRTHYSRWCSLYFEDCSALKSTYPDIFDCFIKEGSVVAQNPQYNNPAKGPCGIIGISQKKEAFCKWNPGFQLIFEKWFTKISAEIGEK